MNRVNHKEGTVNLQYNNPDKNPDIYIKDEITISDYDDNSNREFKRVGKNKTTSIKLISPENKLTLNLRSINKKATSPPNKKGTSSLNIEHGKYFSCFLLLMLTLLIFYIILIKYNIEGTEHNYDNVVYVGTNHDDDLSLSQRIEKHVDKNIIKNSQFNRTGLPSSLSTLESSKDNTDTEHSIPVKKISKKFKLNISDQNTEQHIKGQVDTLHLNEKDVSFNSTLRLNNLSRSSCNITKNENEPILCKICYEPADEEKTLSKPCRCQGSMKYIHLQCLKHWVGDKDVMEVKPSCEICKYIYRLIFEFEYIYSKRKTIAMMKNLALVVIVTLVVLILLDVLVMVVLRSVADFLDSEREKILHVLVGISCAIIFIVLLTYFRDFRENYYDKVLIDWKVKDYEAGII